MRALRDRTTHVWSFCARCGTSLWLWDPRWPDLVHPLASAIDTELPAPPERTHLMLADKPSWVSAHVGPKDRQFDGYPKESPAEWHERPGLSRPDRPVRRCSSLAPGGCNPAPGAPSP